MSEKDALCLTAILDAISKITLFTKSTPDPDTFFLDTKTFDATMMNFIVIGEMVDRISEEFKEMNPQIEWKRIKGIRNLVANGKLASKASPSLSDTLSSSPTFPKRVTLFAPYL